MRIAPRPSVALVVFAAYLVVFYGIWIALGIEYDNIGDSAETIAKWYVAPLTGGALVLAFAVTRLGWWRPVLREERPVGPRWMLAAPLLMLANAVLMLVSKDYSSTTRRWSCCSSSAASASVSARRPSRGVCCSPASAPP